MLLKHKQASKNDLTLNISLLINTFFTPHQSAVYPALTARFSIRFR